jgi:mycothiol system anti-sigma-R factor
VPDAAGEPAPTGCDGSAEGVDCVEAVHQLYSYLDGELTTERRREITVHLDLCSPCGGAAEFEKELRAVIASRCRDRVPDALVARIAEALQREAAGQRADPADRKSDGPSP